MITSEKIKVKFLPDDITIEVTSGENLLRAANAAGIHINASCGAEGVCGKCRVIIKKGKVDFDITEKISENELKKGYCLACRSTVESDLEVEIPVESRLDKSALNNRKERSKTRLLAPLKSDSSISGWHFNPTITKKYIEIDPPTIEDHQSDMARVLRALKKQHNLENISVDFLVIKKLANLLRDGNFKATATIVNTRVESQLGENQLRGSRKPKLMNIEIGDTTDKHYIVVIDIGTTTVCGQLLDIENSAVIAENTDYNMQISHGEDVISRIVFSQKGNGLQVLQEAVVRTMNNVIDNMVKSSEIDRSFISHITVAGNTTMTHLLLNLDPKYIRLAPYTPTVNYIPPIRAKHLGLHVQDHVYLYAFPLVSSYIGGDIVSGVLASGLYQTDKNTLFIDIGTNGEIVLGNATWLVTASCSAGPAFEGGGIKHGMRATNGAIEDLDIDPKTCEPILNTIGNKKPKGICGSGIINAISELLLNGLLEPNGKFPEDIKTDRIRKSEDGMEFVLAYDDETEIYGDIVITEVDIDNFIRAKAAIYAGFQTLLESTGLQYSDIDEVIIAGAFGSYIDIEKSIIVGLLPDLPVDKFQFIGNSSLMGAKMITFSNELLDDSERISKKMTNFELSDNAKFMDYYMAAQFLPHTDLKNFPTVMKMVENIDKKCSKKNR